MIFRAHFCAHAEAFLNRILVLLARDLVGVCRVKDRERVAELLGQQWGSSAVAETDAPVGVPPRLGRISAGRCHGWESRCTT